VRSTAPASVRLGGLHVRERDRHKACFPVVAGGVAFVDLAFIDSWPMFYLSAGLVCAAMLPLRCRHVPSISTGPRRSIMTDQQPRGGFKSTFSPMPMDPIAHPELFEGVLTRGCSPS